MFPNKTSHHWHVKAPGEWPRELLPGTPEEAAELWKSRATMNREPTQPDLRGADLCASRTARIYSVTGVLLKKC